MRQLVLVFLTYYTVQTTNVTYSKSSEEFGTKLVSALREDANLDLSVDEEYEDLRAELLAYHTALASLASSSSRSTFKNKFFGWIIQWNIKAFHCIYANSKIA